MSRPLVALVAVGLLAIALLIVAALALTAGDGGDDAADPESALGDGSPDQTISTTDPRPPPAAPTDFILGLVAGSYDSQGCLIEGSYTDNADNEAGFVIVARSLGTTLATFTDPALDGVGSRGIDQELSGKDLPICVTVYAESATGRRSEPSNEVCFIITASDEFVAQATG